MRWVWLLNLSSFVFGKIEQRPKLLLWRIPALVLAGIFILAHLIIAPLALPVRAAYPMMPKKFTDKLMISGPLDDSIKNQDLVIVNPPVAFFVMVIFSCLGKQQPADASPFENSHIEFGPTRKSISSGRQNSCSSA